MITTKQRAYLRGLANTAETILQIGKNGIDENRAQICASCSNGNAEFAEKLDEIDALYEKKRTIDEKTYQFICFALSIKGRSKPCVLKINFAIWYCPKSFGCTRSSP